MGHRKASGNGAATQLDPFVLRAMEAEILDGPAPVVDPADEARLIGADANLAEAMRGLRCWGEQCTEEALCANCKMRRTYLKLLLHRERYGRAPHPSEIAQPQADGEGDAGQKQLGILLSTVTPERVEWLWPRRIPLGKLTIIDGDPGLGKSVLTLDLAARISRGWPLPDGEPGENGEPDGVVVLSAEDGIKDTIVPRLDAAGADRSRILALESVTDTDGGKRLPSLPGDAPYIMAAVERMQARLVIVDPLTAYLSGFVNAHKDADCRRALWPLVKLAEDAGAAVVVVRHLNKGNASNPLYRGGGSIGIIGAARSGLLVARDPDNADRRVLASTKCNLAKLPPSLLFDLTTADNGALRVGWMGESSHTAEGLLATAHDGEDRGALAEAVDVLRTILAGGPVAAKDVQKDARRAGISDVTLRRAKSILGVRSCRLGFGPAAIWRWDLPSNSTDQAT
jgi:AAA domain